MKISIYIDTFHNVFTTTFTIVSSSRSPLKLKRLLWIFPSLVIPPWESQVHLYLDPLGVIPTHSTQGYESFFFKLCTVIHPSLSEPAGKPTYILPGFTLSPLQSPREQRHNTLCWFWADNVFCLRTARRFTMKSCQCVREHAICLSLSQSLCLSACAVGLLGAWGGEVGRGWKDRGSPAGFLSGWSGGKRCTSGVILAVVVHNSSCFTPQAGSHRGCPL